MTMVKLYPLFSLIFPMSLLGRANEVIE